jgi:hypothetical protein
VQVRTFFINILVVTTKFLCEHIFTRFGCPLTIVTNQGTHFIIDAIRNLINHFILRHTNSTIYYPQANGQAKFINKVFETLLTKLVNENKNDWDEHLSTILFSYQIVYKVGTSHTPFQLVYGLHPLLPREYLLPSKPGENRNPWSFN